MKKLVIPAFFCVFYAARLFGGDSPVSFSGILNSTLNITSPANDNAPDFGFEEYANLRLGLKLNNTAFYSAFNLLAGSGLSAINPGLAAGDNYYSLIELERLYFTTRNESFNFELGLTRLAFGYGQSFSPSDFLNARNPLLPDARSRAVLAGALSFYKDDARLEGFGAAPKNAKEAGGKGIRFGFLAENHWSVFSAQGLYAYTSQMKDYEAGLHRAGFSLKLTNWVIGLWTDTLWTCGGAPDIEGLSSCLGADYTFFGSFVKIYVFAEYLFSGLSSQTSKYAPEAGTADGGAAFENRNYIFASMNCVPDDYTSIALSFLACADDLSFLPALSIEHDILQSLKISFLCQVPLDGARFGTDYAPGEFGPANLGNVIFSLKAKLRF